ELATQCCVASRQFDHIPLTPLTGCRSHADIESLAHEPGRELHQMPAAESRFQHDRQIGEKSFGRGILTKIFESPLHGPKLNIVSCFIPGLEPILDAVYGYQARCR